MGGIFLKIKTWWETADRTQRVVSTVGSGFLLLLIFATYMFASKPHMSLLASSLTSSDQGTIIQELQKMGVPYEMDLKGNVSVPDDKVAELRAKLSLSGKLPKGANMSYDDELAKIGFATTPRVEKERLKGILEARLSQSIDTLDGIDSSQVHIALGDDSPFASEKRSATASIMLSEKSGSNITREQARGIASLVANSVPNLDMTNVTVLNRRGEALVDPEDAQSGQGRVANKLNIEKNEARRRERELQGKLDTIYGAGATVVQLDLELDFDAKRYTETTHKPTDPLVRAESKEEMQGGGGGSSAVGGVAGTRANQPGAPASVTGSGDGKDGKYKTSTKEYEVMTNDKVTQGENPAGTLRKMAINITVDKTKVKDTSTVEAIAKGYLGPRSADAANFQSTVTAVEFDTTAAKAAELSAKSAGSSQKMQQIFSLLPVLALVFVGFMVVKALGKMPSPMMLSTAGGPMISLPANGIDINPELATRLGVSPEQIKEMAATKPKELARMAEEHGVEVHATNGGGLRFSSSAMEEPDLEIESIKRKVNVPLEQIKRMAEERPEVVALLIKSWLMEERG